MAGGERHELRPEHCVGLCHLLAAWCWRSLVTSPNMFLCLCDDDLTGYDQRAPNVLKRGLRDPAKVRGERVSRAPRIRTSSLEKVLCGFKTTGLYLLYSTVQL